MPEGEFLIPKIDQDDVSLYKAVKPIRPQEIDKVLDLMATNHCKKPQTTRALALHCISIMFEQSTGYHLKKEDAYDDFKYYYCKVYPSDQYPSIGLPQFGKLMKVAHRCTTRRLGSRVCAKYCYSHVRLTRTAEDWLEQYRPRMPRVSFIDDMIRFHSIPQPVPSDVDDVFIQFLYNEVMDYKQVDVSNPAVSYLLTILAKSDMLFKNFMQLIDHHVVFDQFISDWYRYGVMQVIAETMPKRDDVLEFIASFPLVLDPEMKSFKDYGYKMPLVKYLKVEFSRYRGHPQKLKIVNFLVELISMFSKYSFPTYILSFKYVTTSVLRHLTLQRSASFSTYWILGCFLDEFTQFLLEYYAFRKGPKLFNRVRAPNTRGGSVVSSREPSVMSETTTATTTTD